jgi:hypothetical protein
VVLLVAWLGWVFDSMDATICNLMLNARAPRTAEKPRHSGNIGWSGGIILGIFLECGSSGSSRRA